MADVWVITPAERVKHDEQFKSINPVGGFITGDQAKGFFLQSRLPPQVLGVIWMLSDMDGDGKMNQTEFSIACKLINLKLRGFNLPQTLSPSLKQSAMVTTSAPAPAVFSNTMPLIPSVPPLPTAVPQPVQPLIQTSAVPLVPLQSVNPPLVQTGVQPALAQPVVAPQVPRAPSQDSACSTTSMDWGVPQASKLKFTQVFNTIDRTKSGFLSGVQSRNILIQSQLPQNILAQIWALSDVDNDGRLSCEEFVLALYLCEQAKGGNKIPPTLPPELIPPTLRRTRTPSVHSQGSAGTPSEGHALTQAQIDNSFEDKRRENYEKGQAELERRRKSLLDAQRRETEERLRKERDEEQRREKARQEAERKRQEELETEMQRQREIEHQKEQERKRQDELKEQAKKDAEKQRQEEWEKQRLQELSNVRQRQQENLLALKAKNQAKGIELGTKDDRIKELSQKISETRTGVTEVKATIDAMRTTRDTHMQDMNSLKAQARDQNQRLLNLNQEKARLKARSLASAAASGVETCAVDASITSKQMVIKQLKEKLEELQMELTAKEEDVNNNKSEFDTIKEQMLLTAERCATLYDEFATKRKQVLELREKLVNPDAAWGDAGSTWTGNISNTTSSTSSKLIESTTSTLPPSNDSTTDILQNRINSTFNAPKRPPPPTGNESSSAAADKWELFDNQSSCLASSPTAKELPESLSDDRLAPAEELRRFRGLYQFDARNEDELSFQPGDIISVLPSHDAEEGWLSGTLKGKVGWFPEAYCESIEDGVSSLIAPTQDVTGVPLNGEPVSTTIPDDSTLNMRLLGEATSLFQFKATQNNHLSFNKSERIAVREALEQWWFGEVNGVCGWFPMSFAKMLSHNGALSPVTTPLESPELPQMPDELVHDDISEYYRAVYPYQSGEEGDLIFEADELILVVKKEGEWWNGLICDRRGMFPSNYVQICENQIAGTKTEDSVVAAEPAVEKPKSPEAVIPEKVEVKENDIKKEEVETVQVTKQEEKDDDDAVNKGKTKGKPEIAQVLAPYDATSSNQLSLARGQLVMIRKRTASGWWEGELQAKGRKRQIGWFPASYVKILGGSSRTTPVSMEMTGRDDPMSGEYGSNVVVIQKPVVIKKESPQPKERVEALYPYAAMNDDELSFEPGDIIDVLDKEDSAWWKGTLKGSEGVFPSNYVQAFTGQKLDASSPPEDSLC